MSWFNPSWQLGNIQPLTQHTHTETDGMARRVGKKVKLSGWGKSSLITEANNNDGDDDKGENKKESKTQEPVQNTFAHHPLTNTQPQAAIGLSWTIPPSLYPQHGVCGMEYPFGHLRSAVHASS